jgi:putative transposase
MKRFKSPRHRHRFVSIRDPIANLFHFPRHSLSASDFRTLRADAMKAWQDIAGVQVAA